MHPPQHQTPEAHTPEIARADAPVCPTSWRSVASASNNTTQMLPRQQARGPRRKAAHAARREGPRAKRSHFNSWRDRARQLQCPCWAALAVSVVPESVPFFGGNVELADCSERPEE